MLSLNNLIYCKNIYQIYIFQFQTQSFAMHTLVEQTGDEKKQSATTPVGSQVNYSSSILRDQRNWLLQQLQCSKIEIDLSVYQSPEIFSISTSFVTIVQILTNLVWYFFIIYTLKLSRIKKMTQLYIYIYIYIYIQIYIYIKEVKVMMDYCGYIISFSALLETQLYTFYNNIVQICQNH